MTPGDARMINGICQLPGLERTLLSRSKQHPSWKLVQRAKNKKEGIAEEKGAD